MNNIENSNSVFESIKHLDESGREFWYARELQIVLEYKLWQNFEKVLKRAIISCNNSKNNSLYHFIDINKMVDISSNTTRKIEDYKLSRYACYLIAQNGDSRKKVIAREYMIL